MKSSRTKGAAAGEPIYLASQLASICDVDLKTIHNWCDRNDDPEAPAELESFRTTGGHLRFKHSAVLRFLTRWGYPLPDALLQDRPHVLMIEGDPATRASIVSMLRLVRPGEDVTKPTPRATDAAASTLGLWASTHYYLHLWDDACTALVALGERTGAGAPPDVVVLSVDPPGIDVTAWIKAARAGKGDDAPRVVLLASGAAPTKLSDDVARVVPRAKLEELVWILDQEARALQSRLAERHSAARKAMPRRRVPMAPREPIFVASQVATIWGVDLKTVHNWVERGDMEAFRTPGRHLRFRRRSLLSFLRRYNMEIPRDLAPQAPRVMIVDRDAARVAKLRALLGARFEVLSQPDGIVALAEIGMHSSGAALIDAVVVALPVEGADAEVWVSALLRHPDTRYALLLTLGGDAEQHRRLQALGVTATVAGGAIEQVPPVLEQALGLVQR